VVAPFRYSVIIFSVVLGFLVFGEVLDLSTVLGIAIVVAAGVYTFHRERVRAAEAARKS
jgi:drug/metabolite transporter (DMT)-like permease